MRTIYEQIIVWHDGRFEFHQATFLDQGETLRIYDEGMNVLSVFHHGWSIELSVKRITLQATR